MNKFAIAFWILMIGTLGWCGTAFVGLVVSQSYHPMAALGDLLHPLRLAAFGLAVITAIVIAVLHINRRPLSSRTYIIGMIVAALCCALPLLPRIDSGYKQTFYVADQRHDIPWQFDPAGRSETAGGTFIRIRVDPDTLVEDYQSLSRSVTLGKSTDYNYGRGGDAPAEICTASQYTFSCEWPVGDLIYSIRGDVDNRPDDMAAFQDQAVALLDSFATP